MNTKHFNQMTIQQLDEIKNRYYDEGWSNDELMEEYHLDYNQLYSVVNDQTDTFQVKMARKIQQLHQQISPTGKESHLMQFRRQQLKTNKWHTNKLTTKQVASIRDLYFGGGITQKQLAQQFNVQPPAISNIITGRTWKLTT